MSEPLLFEGDKIVDGLVTRAGIDYSLGAIPMRDGEWCVRPNGVCGTCGHYYGRSWNAVFVKAIDESAAVRKAKQYVWAR